VFGLGLPLAILLNRRRASARRKFAPESGRKTNSPLYWIVIGVWSIQAVSWIGLLLYRLLK
jgi:hypothetical protein